MTIRGYQPGDREAVERICLSTGLRGHLTDLFRDADIFLDVWLSPYLNNEPQNAWVAEQDGRVVGYLVSSFSPRFAVRALPILLRNAGRMVTRLLAGRYRDHAPSRRFVRWFVLRALWETPRHPKASAHLHFNVETRHRGNDFREGAGGLLLAEFERRVRDSGLDGYYGILFTGERRRSVRFYERAGYRLHDKRRCTLFPGEDVWLTTIVRTVRSDPCST